MSFPVVLIFAAFIFAVQLLVCFEANKAWVRFLPVSLSLGFEALCWILFFVGKVLRMEDSIGFPAFILGYIGLYWFLAPLGACAVYGFVKLIQKRRK